MADLTPGHGFPQAIAASVIEVMAAVGVLGKDRERNDAGAKYKFASIDDFIEHVRAHCITAGLFIITSEEGEARLIDVTDGKGKPMVVWWTRFAFTLVHKSGESYGPIYKTVMVRAGGAQAAGAAQSYAMKQFMRGLFQIPTGEGDDPDKETVDLRSRGDDDNYLQKQASRIRKDILAAENMDELGRAWADNAMTLDHIKTTSETAHEFLYKEYLRKKELIENG